MFLTGCIQNNYNSIKPTFSGLKLMVDNYLSQIIKKTNGKSDFVAPRFASSTGNIHSLDSLLNQDQKIIIIGPPGSGKTSTLKYVEFVFAKKN